jgi:uncharacterized repeat protein (TIGR01451 family)
MRRSWKTICPNCIIAALCLAAISGCASTRNSGIDPSGDHIFVQPVPCGDPIPPNQPFRNEPSDRRSWDDVVVLLDPREPVVAPVGTDVVLVAGVGGADGFLHTNRRLEWTISQGSVGQFVSVEKNGFVDWLLGDFNWPRKVSNTFAVGSTSREYVRLTRGPCNPETDVHVLRGQSWITLTSPVEGDSHVTVLAPEVRDWNARTRSTVVHWVDAQWRLPPPAINPAGTTHVFTTCVMRQTNQSPCEGWRVRYEILDGPAAGFSPDGASAVEVPTDAAGQASAEIIQKQPAHGTNRICIQIIRPGGLPGTNGQRLVVGSGATMKTWSAADLSVRIRGPAVASVGATATFRIEVGNPGDLPTKDVVITEKIPEGFTFLGSNPPAETSGQQLQWRIGELGGRQQRVIELNFRADRLGSVANCCEATAAPSMKVSDCVTTTIGQPPATTPDAGAAPRSTPSSEPTKALPVEIAINPAAATATVGEKVLFEIMVTNRGAAAATQLTLTDRFDPGLDPPDVANAAATHSMSISLDLAPGESKRIPIEFQVAQPGKLCHTVEVSRANASPVTRQACVTASAPAADTGGQTTAPEKNAAGQQQGKATTQSGSPSNQPPSGESPLAVKMSGPEHTMAVGEMVRFVIDVANTGTTPLRNIKVVDTYDKALLPKSDTEMLASTGYTLEGYDLVWKEDSLDPGKSLQYEIQCKCQTPTVGAYNRVTVTAGEGSPVSREVRFDIRIAGSDTPDSHSGDGAETQATGENKTPMGELSMSVPGTHNPITVGKGVTYRIYVTNNTDKVYRNVSVTATFPKGLVPSRLGTRGPGGLAFQTDLGAGKLRFDPVLEVRPGESLAFEVLGVARKPTKGEFEAELRSDDLPQPIVQKVSAEAVE